MASSSVQLQDLNDGGGGDGGVDRPPVADTGVDAAADGEEVTSSPGGRDAVDQEDSRSAEFSPTDKDVDQEDSRNAEFSPTDNTKSDISKAEPPSQDTAVNEASVPEKLADDVMLPPLWKRMLFRVFPSLERSECSVSWSISALLSWLFYCS